MHINEVLFTPVYINKYSCMPIILGGSILNSGKCFVID